MKKLISMFKSLPPEMRMMLAMAGLGSPAGIIYILKKYLFPGWSWIKVILVVAAVIAVISLLGFIVAKLFGRGRRKRSKKMAADLASEADSDRVSMDGRAAIKANNEKFFNAIRDMRKNLGLSVYDLPWYVVIGDSGCGKTRLINEGGLTFSTGKPEGYQLGTLNYNWWFTEDAIFVDMAGRLCNPQEDADRREWQAVLGAIAKGRKGFPINGVLVCVSAEHLLQDPAEKVEQEANTALERLRDLQGKLGVTFATYLVVTKCDKILGFMQLFDRAERDITVKNQIFGWSKPGDFHELHDPESFGADFDRVYERLNELRLRRLNDEVDEIDVGMAYSFPEEFRELRAPLQTYVRTLFPMIKNPRAIKNLIFRGIYFTSATQEGELILKHLTERLGADAAGQFPTLDLYPNKRPYFIKDLLFRKVFPEHGLVFRNEEQAVRNRKLGKMLRVGSVALAVLLFGMVGVSTWKFRQVIGKPRDDAWATKPD
ncbi:MAG: type VI secretion protein IcmF/TssM N-terminal domain-containing protein, partial [Planctomycetota bacterium]